MNELIFESLGPYLIDAIFVFIIAISGYFGLKHGLSKLHKVKMQSKSVTARVRNRMTKKYWDDLMDIRIMGVFPVGKRLEDLLWDLMPRLMEDLEEQRTKNPAVWRESIKFLTPIALYLKGMAKYKPKEMISNVFDYFTTDDGEDPEMYQQNREEFIQSVEQPIESQAGNEDEVPKQNTYERLV